MNIIKDNTIVKYNELYNQLVKYIKENNNFKKIVNNEQIINIINKLKDNYLNENTVNYDEIEECLLNVGFYILTYGFNKNDNGNVTKTYNMSYNRRGFTLFDLIIDYENKYPDNLELKDPFSGIIISKNYNNKTVDELLTIPDIEKSIYIEDIIFQINSRIYCENIRNEIFKLTALSIIYETLNIEDGINFINSMNNKYPHRYLEQVDIEFINKIKEDKIRSI